MAVTKNADNKKIWDSVRDYFPHPYTEKNAVDFIIRTRSFNPPCDFAITLDGEAIGAIGYILQNDVQRISAEVGYWIGESHWNKGIVSKVLDDFSGFLFYERGLENIYATVFSTNPASMRVLEKAGFSFVGIMHNAAIKNGVLVDLHYYEKVKPGGK